jgi:hypothetical protein
MSLVIKNMHLRVCLAGPHLQIGKHIYKYASFVLADAQRLRRWQQKSRA